ncbi:MAG: M15 family metallopeptidase [Candidatus Ancaeobacter aquaticus]|nr:M15 family metallopeptidase [Candidatus Ancaeobacter aquaticus]
MRFIISCLCIAISVCVSSCAINPLPKKTDFVNVQSVIPSIIVDLKYATKDNFTHQVLYATDTCYLRRGTAYKLQEVHYILKKKGFGLKIFDGYRPLYVQKKLWKMFPDLNYVADPAKGSFHNRGAAVDVTLVTPDGKEVPMGTEFDDFTQKAHLSCTDLPENVINNRILLVRTMIRCGFIPHETEWWHFTDRSWRLYDIENTDPKEFEGI